MYIKKYPPEESGGISLTLKTTNMNDVDIAKLTVFI